ncbi:MAG TPA: hypothetical protein VK550_17805 [Polyangiaceae bacterium]|jgi:hypothetical protein|nr:hypothetical protein [Polyangiaceae bacterium]
MSAYCRSCGARIVWAKTPAGKAMPLDADPVTDGNIVLEEDNAGAIAHVRSAAFGGVGVFHKSHFATCPNAARHRKPKDVAR